MFVDETSGHVERNRGFSLLGSSSAARRALFLAPSSDPNIKRGRRSDDLRRRTGGLDGTTDISDGAGWPHVRLGVPNPGRTSSRADTIAYYSAYSVVEC